VILTEHLPSLAEVANLLDALGVRDCEVEHGAVLPEAPVTTAVYHPRGGSGTAAAAVMDLSLAASLGAALVGIPAAVVHEAVAAGELPGPLEENLYEVVNVLASLLHSPATAGVQLSELGVPPTGGALPVEMTAGGQLRVYLVSMRGYPGGTLALYGTV